MVFRLPGTCYEHHWPLSCLTIVCKTYEVITGVALFKNHVAEVDGVELDATNWLLVQMMGHTRESFKPEQLPVSPGAGQYFDKWCTYFFNEIKPFY